jgi:hypothetical protein
MLRQHLKNTGVGAKIVVTRFFPGKPPITDSFRMTFTATAAYLSDDHLVSALDYYVGVQANLSQHIPHPSLRRGRLDPAEPDQEHTGNNYHEHDDHDCNQRRIHDKFTSVSGIALFDRPQVSGEQKKKYIKPVRLYIKGPEGMIPPAGYSWIV